MTDLASGDRLALKVSVVTVKCFGVIILLFCKRLTVDHTSYSFSPNMDVNNLQHPESWNVTLKPRSNWGSDWNKHQVLFQLEAQSAWEEIICEWCLPLTTCHIFLMIFPAVMQSLIVCRVKSSWNDSVTLCVRYMRSPLMLLPSPNSHK